MLKCPAAARRCLDYGASKSGIMLKFSNIMLKSGKIILDFFRALRYDRRRKDVDFFLQFYWLTGKVFAPKKEDHHE